ncbi:helix-turn-helix domain-containing protein [Sphaerisporangium aureirubrum]|uniref:Helix-turn-helix domain-containing protein n=1 Tax=Sphaerisporangium aureirubrum TaxID=1544736 RepID=A0ABW1NLS0_9ACTN
MNENWDSGYYGTEEHTGQRIARWRKLRGLTQSGLAIRAHLSRSLVAQVETGHKPATPSMVAAVAKALSLDVAKLHGQPFGEADRSGNAVHAAIPAIRRAFSYADVAPDLGMPPRSLKELSSELVRLQKLQGAAFHQELALRLPAVIEELTVHAVGSGKPRAWRLLNRADAVAVSLARRLGYNDLAQVGIERAADAARRADDPYLPHLVMLSRALLLLTTGEWDLALVLMQRSVGQVDEDERPESTSVLGALHLRAAVAAARAGRGAEAWEHHGVAADAARRNKDKKDVYALQVMPANAAIHGCAVAAELGDVDEAIRLDERLSLPMTMLAERRAHHEIDMSRALVWAGNANQSLTRVLRAEKIAPQMTYFHPTARETVKALDRYYRVIPEPLRALQERMFL